MEDFDFTAEHPKADMSKVDVIRVNGKEYLAADKVMAIIEDVRRDANYGYMFDMVKEIRRRIEELKGGDKK